MSLSSRIRSQRGVAFIEFALLLPILLIVLYGAVEVARYISIHQQVGRTAAQISDFIARHEEISDAELQKLLASSSQLMQKHSFVSHGKAISFSVKNQSGTYIVEWQRDYGSLNSNSKIIQGSSLIDNDFVTLLPNEQIIGTEIFFDYTPILFNMFGDEIVYKAKFAKPRNGVTQVYNN